MITQEMFSGMMVNVYQVMEKMDRKQRKQMLLAIKDARIQMDFAYPEGKPDIIVPTEEQKHAILRNDTRDSGTVLSEVLREGSSDTTGTPSDNGRVETRTETLGHRDNTGGVAEVDQREESTGC
jgi:hypothetical protein